MNNKKSPSEEGTKKQLLKKIEWLNRENTELRKFINDEFQVDPKFFIKKKIMLAMANIINDDPADYQAIIALANLLRDLELIDLPTGKQKGDPLCTSTT